jgi:hypothetical protein
MAQMLRWGVEGMNRNFGVGGMPRDIGAGTGVATREKKGRIHR